MMMAIRLTGIFITVGNDTLRMGFNSACKVYVRVWARLARIGASWIRPSFHGQRQGQNIQTQHGECIDFVVAESP